jgi:hypothetical protein
MILGLNSCAYLVMIQRANSTGLGSLKNIWTIKVLLLILFVWHFCSMFIVLFLHFYHHTSLTRLLNWWMGMKFFSFSIVLTLSNPIFLPPAYSSAHIYFRQERGWWVTCNYPTVLKEKNRKSTTCAICWLESILHEEKHQEQENHNVRQCATLWLYSFCYVFLF